VRPASVMLVLEVLFLRIMRSMDVRCFRMCFLALKRIQAGIGLLVARQEQSVEHAEEGRKDEPVAAHRGLVLGLLTMAQFVVVLDFSIVQIALPTMRSDLHVSVADSTWMISIYGLTLAGLLIFGGRAGDIYGRKRLFIINLVIFSIGSLAGGLAPDLLVLLVAHCIQGIGAAFASSTSLSLIVAFFPEGKERTRALGIFTAAAAGAFGAGILAGGLLTSVLGWRSVMFVNVPIGVAAAAVASRFLPESFGMSKEEGLDVPGAVTITSALMVLDYGLTIAQTATIVSIQALGPIGLSALIFCGFLAMESRVRSPLIPLEFLRRRSVLTSNPVALVVTAAFSGTVFLLALFLQQIAKYSPVYAGLAFLPTSLINLAVGGFASPRLADRFGPRRVLIPALILQAAGYTLLTEVSLSGGYWATVLPGLTLASFGAGASFPAFRIAAVSGTRKGEEGVASGLVNTSQQIGAPIGVTVLMTIAGMFDKGIASGDVSPSTLPAIHYAFIGAAAFSLVGAIVAAMMKDEDGREPARDRGRQGKERHPSTEREGDRGSRPMRYSGHHGACRSCVLWCPHIHQEWVSFLRAPHPLLYRRVKALGVLYPGGGDTHRLCYRGKVQPRMVEVQELIILGLLRPMLGRLFYRGPFYAPTGVVEYHVEDAYPVVLASP
jgi:MFS family permease